MTWKKYIFERGQIEPEFAAMVTARTSRRMMQYKLAQRRIALGLTQTEVAKRLAEDHLRVDVSLRRALGSPNAVDRV